MDLDRLYQILRDTTVQLRKGAEVEEREVSGVKVIEVYDMPHESKVPDGIVKVDCHFIVVGVDKAKAQSHREELLKILKSYPRLTDGPSYIEVGGEIGDQGAAFQLFALGEVLGFWNVMTPAKLRTRGPAADEMAGQGFVMIDGFKTSN